MTKESCLTLVLLLGLLSVCASSSDQKNNDTSTQKLKQCFDKTTNFLVNEMFFSVITSNPWNDSKVCVVLLQKNTTVNNTLDQWWPQVEKKNESQLLYLSKRHTGSDTCVYALTGNHCNYTTFSISRECSYKQTQSKGNCSVTCFQSRRVCENATYDKTVCETVAPHVKDKYIINITDPKPTCFNCDDPVTIPSAKVELNVSTGIMQGEVINPRAAVEVMTKMADLASSINESAVVLSVGNGVTGVLVANKDPVDIAEVSFAYGSPNSSISIISSGGNVTDFSRSVSLPKEAFNKALSMNIPTSFAALMRFNNMAKDALNSTILGNEVLAVEMGASIANLTDKINISFRNMNYNGVPACHSWNGNGSRPNWTDDGCSTITNGPNITCQCSHLTFFAILMMPPNETISSTDLYNLTIATQIGCGLSMFFLGIILFMHFLLRKTKATKATKILIHLVTAMFLLDFAFLVNNFVAKLNNAVGCKIMAAFMHYFMLATFTWFAAQAFHLCLQLYTGGKIEISRYMLKVSVTSWIIPSVIGVVLLITGKYGTQIIYTDNSANNVAMCWITDSNIHYIVNIGYYALVFLFTFTTFIIIVSWLFCLRRNKGNSVQASKSGKSIVTILGLCCMLGITWGFAFFAYGPLQIPAYYIFTILNSFQGFFLFIYYYNTSRNRPTQAVTSGNKNSSLSTATLQTNLDILENPYVNSQSQN